MAIKNFEQLYSLSGDLILPKVQVINNLTSTDSTKPLAASQGKILQDHIDDIFDENGTVKSLLLPSYVDDILEFTGGVAGSVVETGTAQSVVEIQWDTTKKIFVGKGSNGRYYSNWGGSSSFPEASRYGTVGTNGVTPMRNKIYVGVSTGFANIYTDKTYRWSGSDLVEISKSIALGETSSTAYAGDKGKAVTDKVAKMSNAVWMSGFKDYTTTTGGVTLLGQLKQYDASGNVINYDGDDTLVNLPVADAGKAGIITSATYNKIQNAAASGTSYTKTESDNKYSTKTDTGKSLAYGGDSATDGYYLDLKNSSGTTLTELLIPVVETSVSAGGSDHCGMMSTPDKDKLDKLPNDGIVAITEAELNAILV